jgi:hypothetical protein
MPRMPAYAVALREARMAAKGIESSAWALMVEAIRVTSRAS